MMNAFIIVLLYSTGVVLEVNAMRVEEFSLPDGTVSEKNNNITLNCDVTISASDGLQTLNVLKENVKIASCYMYSGVINTCSLQNNVSTRYRVTYNKPSMKVLITRLQRRDAGNWYCAFQSMAQITLLQLTVYIKVSSITIQNDAVTEKGNDITLICNIKQFAESQSIYVYKTEGTVIQDSNNYLDVCIQYDCLQGGTLLDNKYRITADNTSIFILIKQLTVAQDDKWWTCRDHEYNSQQQRKLIVYASPVSLVLDGDVNGGDLQNEALTLKCQSSNCIFPAPPEFQWFYQQANTQLFLYTNTSATASSAFCSGSERVYTTTLHLDRQTTWPLEPSNVETTVNFQCRLGFPTLQSPLASTGSGNVTYAVTSVTLKDGDRTPSSTDTIDVISGVPKTLTCTPSTSRPPATIVWYIGSTVKQRGSSLYYIYTPDYGDNDKRIYCKAYNIQNESSAVSSNSPALNINVKVTSVTLYDGSSSPGSNDAVVVTENQEKTLSCRTGASKPVSTIAWFINGQIKQNGIDTNFIFTPTNNDHGKRIYCRAYNVQPLEEAITSASPKLYVEGKPSVPISFNYIGIVKGVPTFTFVGGFNGGFIQTFIVETTLFGTDNWIEQIRFNETQEEFVTKDRLKFRLNITGLQPNTYDIRILAENSIGRIEQEDAPTLSFTIKKPEEEPSPRPVAAIAGGSSTAVVTIVIAAVVVGVFIRKRRLMNKDDGTNEQKLEDFGATERGYDNLTSHDDTHQYTAVEPETAFQYETLQESLKGNTATETYEQLQVQDERTSASVSAVTEKSPTMGDTTVTDKVYENMRI